MQETSKFVGWVTYDGENGEIIPSLDLKDPTISSSKQDWNDSKLYKLAF